jgi:integrase/recombinase XerC
LNGTQYGVHRVTVGPTETSVDPVFRAKATGTPTKIIAEPLYGTCARAEELLQVNIEDLDLAGRCCPVKSKGAKPRTRRRSASHAEHVPETVYWDAGTARLRCSNGSVSCQIT